MNRLRETLKQIVEKTLLEALTKVRSHNFSLSDMYVQINIDDNIALVIYDDADNEICTSQLCDCKEIKSSIDADDLMPYFTDLLIETVNQPQVYNSFNECEYEAPFSLLLVNSEMEIIKEILTIDHENILIEDDFWEKIDKELDEFYEKLMSDIRYK